MTALNKIAKYYLVFLVIYYLATGLGALEAFLDDITGVDIPLLDWLQMLGLVGSGFGAVPYQAIRWGAHSQDSAVKLALLGILAIVIGVFSLVALWRTKKSPRWILLWYFIALLAWVIAISNFYIDLHYSETLALYMQTIHPLLLSLALYLIHRNTVLLERKSMPS